VGFAAGCSLALASKAGNSITENASTSLRMEPLGSFINHFKMNNAKLRQFCVVS